MNFAIMARAAAMLNALDPHNKLPRKARQAALKAFVAQLEAARA